MAKKITKKTTTKQSKKEDVVIANKKVANEKEIKKEKRNQKLLKSIKTIDDNRKIIYALIGGLLLGIFIMRVILWPDRIATLKDGTQPVATIKDHTVTADELYENMKAHYSVSLLLDDIDTVILEKMYKEDDEMSTSVEETANYYYDSYSSYYGTTKEDFLSQNNFKSHDDFLTYLKLDYRRNKYFDEYTEKLITDKEIENYYNDSVYGDINTKHILVEITEEVDDATAKKKAEEIISKLNAGATFDEVKEEYKDSTTFEELGYQAFNASLETAYVEEMKNLANDSYSKTPVKTSYGYHVVYRIDQKEKAKLEDVKEEVIDALAKEKKTADKNLYYKALVNLREENELTFKDTVMGDKYTNYIAQYK